MNPEPDIETPASLPERIVLYDGGCPLCDRSVRWLLERDRRGRLAYAPLEGSTAERLRAAGWQVPPGMDTVVFFDAASRRKIYLRSRAVIRIARYLEPPWNALGWLRILPAFLGDPVYRLISRLRHRLGKALGPIAPPPAEVKRRFLD